MALELLESLSLSGGAVNEDAFGHHAGAAVILDGATPLGDPVMPGKSDAAWIAQFGARRVLAHLRDAMSPRKALRGALADAEKSFNALRLRELEDVWQTPCASMMLAAISPSALRSAGAATGTSPMQGADAPRGRGAAIDVEFLWFGDCAALVIEGEGPLTVVGESFDKKAGESRTAGQAAKDSNRPATAREHHLDGLRARRNAINDGAAWLFSPLEKAAAHAARRVMTLSPGAVILLASDGFLALATDYGAYSADTLMQAAMDRGLDVLGEELRAIEQADADGVKFPRFKTSDDATALLLKLA
ncbi:MAG TPA: hypothetical protein VG821_02085 [Rhizomicrobium sp.]|jgi:hypothetical protein|nr:hypothetical protein [Rhizomicrobium sp.]